MREYDKTTLKVAERIFEKGDEILEQRKKKAAKIRHISYAASGLCAALIVGFGAWKLQPSLKKLSDSFKEQPVITSSVSTVTAVSETDAVTTAVNTSSAKTEITSATAVKTTAAPHSQTAALIVTTSPARTAARIHTTSKIAEIPRTTANTTTTSSVNITTVTTSQIEETVIIPETNIEESYTPTTTSLEVSPVTTTSLEVAPVTTSAKLTTADGPVTTVPTVVNPTGAKTEKELREYMSKFPVSVTVNNIRYEKIVAESTFGDRPVSADKVGELICTADVNILVSLTKNIVQPMEVYELKNTDTDRAVAVKIPATNEYYVLVRYRE